MNSEESRLRTFANWPDNAAVDARRIAKAGFYYMGQGMEVQCFSCGSRISEWNYGDKVMAKHRALDPRCPFVLNPAMSGNVPLLSSQHRVPPSTTLNRAAVPPRNPEHVDPRRQLAEQQSPRAPSTTPSPDLSFLDEGARLESFATWPNSFVSPQQLARAGFYYTQVQDQVCCVFCRGVVLNWAEGDDPDAEHRRHFPTCPFVAAKDEEEMSVQAGINLRESEIDLSDLGISSHKIPRSPKYSTYEARLRTYTHWPPSLGQTPEELADAGFYFTGMGDKVRCFHCDGGLRFWQKKDCPWVEHARWFNECGFVHLIKGREFIEESLKSFPPSLTEDEQSCLSKLTPLNVKTKVNEAQLTELMNSPVAITALQVGIEASRVKSALKHKVETTGRSFEDHEADALIISCLDIQTEESSSNEDNWPTTPPCTLQLFNQGHIISPRDETRNPEGSPSESGTDEEPNDRTSAPVETKNVVEAKEPAETLVKAPAEKSDSVSLEEENRRLKEARLCKICMDKEVGVVLLPCGHLVTCVNCAHSLRNCPLCRQVIKATVRTFLS